MKKLIIIIALMISVQFVSTQVQAQSITPTVAWFSNFASKFSYSFTLAGSGYTPVHSGDWQYTDVYI